MATTVESVWRYPRPPAVVTCPRHVRVEVGGETVASSDRALRVLETSHPATIYIPPDDLRQDLLEHSGTRATWCEFKGRALYLDVIIFGRRYERVAWTYPDPSPGYESLRNYIAFYPGRVDGAWLDDERVRAQPSDFYGGWITDDVAGPFKGSA